ncbi:hypothetical protein D9615_007743 [Tricholomella constricta]|uniref:Uncharacterized protein n=1 Tax=Tricholomella constricta TaxID=117010 RepID=A0A8H5M0G0_9AGAR|nr:hypothetical protein D9615_007743 [Tricholomella constricta]
MANTYPRIFVFTGHKHFLPLLPPPPLAAPRPARLEPPRTATSELHSRKKDSLCHALFDANLLTSDFQRRPSPHSPTQPLRATVYGHFVWLTYTLVPLLSQVVNDFCPCPPPLAAPHPPASNRPYCRLRIALTEKDSLYHPPFDANLLTSDFQRRPSPPSPTQPLRATVYGHFPRAPPASNRPYCRLRIALTKKVKTSPLAAPKPPYLATRPPRTASYCRLCIALTKKDSLYHAPFDANLSNLHLLASPFKGSLIDRLFAPGPRPPLYKPRYSSLYALATLTVINTLCPSPPLAAPRPARLEPPRTAASALHSRKRTVHTMPLLISSAYPPPPSLLPLYKPRFSSLYALTTLPVRPALPPSATHQSYLKGSDRPRSVRCLLLFLLPKDVAAQAQSVSPLPSNARDHNPGLPMGIVSQTSSPSALRLLVNSHPASSPAPRPGEDSGNSSGTPSHQLLKAVLRSQASIYTASVIVACNLKMLETVIHFRFCFIGGCGETGSECGQGKARLGGGHKDDWANTTRKGTWMTGAGSNFGATGQHSDRTI